MNGKGIQSSSYLKSRFTQRVKSGIPDLDYYSKQFPTGYVRLHHVSHMTMPTALTGGFVGLLGGLILFNPILAVMGLVGGSAFGAVLGTLKEVGID